MTDKKPQDLTNEHRTTLNAFSRALAREAHVLTHHLDLLWQQPWEARRQSWKHEGS